MFDGGSSDYIDYVNQGLGYAEGRTGEANDLLNPYRRMGMMSAAPLMRFSRQTITDPGSYYNNMMSGYETSPAAQAQMAASQEAAMNAASASGGLGGTNMYNQIQQDAQGIMAQDSQRYMDNLMNLQRQGLGVGQNIFNTGYGASGQQAQNLHQTGLAGLRAYSSMGQAAQMAGLESGRNWASLAGGVAGAMLPRVSSLAQGIMNF